MADPKGHKAESDVEADSDQVRSRKGHDDGSYVGRTGADDAERKRAAKTSSGRACCGMTL